MSDSLYLHMSHSSLVVLSWNWVVAGRQKVKTLAPNSGLRLQDYERK